MSRALLRKPPRDAKTQNVAESVASHTPFATTHVFGGRGDKTQRQQFHPRRLPLGIHSLGHFFFLNPTGQSTAPNGSKLRSLTPQAKSTPCRREWASFAIDPSMHKYAPNFYNMKPCAREPHRYCTHRGKTNPKTHDKRSSSENEASALLRAIVTQHQQPATTPRAHGQTHKAHYDTRLIPHRRNPPVQDTYSRCRALAQNSPNVQAPITHLRSGFSPPKNPPPSLFRLRFFAGTSRSVAVGSLGLICVQPRGPFVPKLHGKVRHLRTERAKRWRNPPVCMYMYVGCGSNMLVSGSQALLPSA